MIMFSCFGQHHFSNGKCNFRGKEGDEFTPKVGIFKHSISNNQIGELNGQMFKWGIFKQLSWLRDTYDRQWRIFLRFTVFFQLYEKHLRSWKKKKEKKKKKRKNSCQGVTHLVLRDRKAYSLSHNGIPPECNFPIKDKNHQTYCAMFLIQYFAPRAKQTRQIITLNACFK